MSLCELNSLNVFLTIAWKVKTATITMTWKAWFPLVPCLRPLSHLLPFSLLQRDHVSFHLRIFYKAVFSFWKDFSFSWKLPSLSCFQLFNSSSTFKFILYYHLLWDSVIPEHPEPPVTQAQRPVLIIDVITHLFVFLFDSCQNVLIEKMVIFQEGRNCLLSIVSEFPPLCLALRKCTRDILSKWMQDFFFNPSARTCV